MPELISCVQGQNTTLTQKEYKKIILKQTNTTKQYRSYFIRFKLDYGSLWSKFSFTGQEGNIRI